MCFFIKQIGGDIQMVFIKYDVGNLIVSSFQPLGPCICILLIYNTTY